jgi:translocation and assembly module TamB
VDRGLLTFANPYRIEPVIDLAATTRVRDYEVELSLSGTPDRLNASYRSDPPLADLEVLSLVATGSPEVVGGGAGGSIAESFLFGQAASAISKRVGSLFGLDTFRIDPVGSGGGSVSGVRVTVEKRLTKSFAVSYSQDPSSTENQILQARWAVQDNLTLVFTLEGDETYAVDVRWEKGF